MEMYDVQQDSAICVGTAELYDRGGYRPYPGFLIKLKQKGHKCYKIIVFSMR